MDVIDMNALFGAILSMTKLCVQKNSHVSMNILFLIAQHTLLTT